MPVAGNTDYEVQWADNKLMARTNNGRTFRYPGNPPVMGGKRWRGKKVQDEVTGFWTYEDYLVTDDYGDKVDGRSDAGYDLDPQNS